MEYNYDEVFKELIKEMNPTPSDRLYGVVFVAGPGTGKSTVAKMLSEKLGIIAVANDQIRRFYDSLGFDSVALR